MMALRKACVGWAWAIVALGFGGSSPIRADIVVNQPVLGGSPSFTSNLQGGSDQQVADQFSLTSSHNITSITWWGSYSRVPLSSDAPTDSFDIKFFSALDTVKAPLAVITIDNALIRAATNPELFDFTGVQRIFQYQATLPTPVKLAGGTNYISIVNHTTPVWGWVGSDDSGSVFVQNGSGPWQSFNLGNRALLIEGTPSGPGLSAVPEPSSLIMAGLAGLGLALAHQRRKRSNVRATISS